MAKIGEGEPFVVEALKAGPGGLVAVQNAALAAAAADLDDVINKYYRIDWHFIAAALELTTKALKSHLDPPFLKIADSLTHRCVAMSTIIPTPRGGVTLRAA